MERTPFESNDALWRRLSARSVGFAVIFATAVALRAAPSHRTSWPFALGAAGFSLLAMLALVVRANPWPRLVPVRVTADAQSLIVGARVIARERIHTAVLVPGEGPGKPYVRVLLKRGLPVEIGIPSAEEGRALLRALGFDASQHASEFQTTSFVGLAATALFLTPLLLLPAMLHWSLAPFAIAFGVALLGSALLFPTKISVGADGISIRKLGRTRFIRADQIEWVQTYSSFQAETARGVLIQLKNGEQVKIPIGGNGLGKHEGNKEIAAFIERVEEAMEVYRTGAIESAAALLDRGSRAAADWVRALRAIGAGANATLRTAAVDPERLARVVESPAARPIDRAAAAVAIQSSDDEDAKARVRVAANAVADVRLRVALDAATTGDEARIEAALDALESER